MSEEPYTPFEPIDPQEPTHKAEQIVGYLDDMSADVRSKRVVAVGLILVQADGQVQTRWFDPGAEHAEGQRFGLIAGAALLQHRLVSQDA